MKCKTCNKKLVFVTTNPDNGLVGYWVCNDCKTK